MLARISRRSIWAPPQRAATWLHRRVILLQGPRAQSRAAWRIAIPRANAYRGRTDPNDAHPGDEELREWDAELRRTAPAESTGVVFPQKRARPSLEMRDSITVPTCRG